METMARRVAAVLMPMIGGMAWAVQPGFVQALVVAAGLDDREAGYVASAEMAGFAAAAIAVAALPRGLDWRRIVGGLLVVSTIANIGMAWAEGFWAIFTLRGIAGFAGGGVMSIGFAAIGMTRDPDRNYGWNIALAGMATAVVLYWVPALIAAAGLAGLLAWYIGWNVVGLGFVKHLPQADARPSGTSVRPGYPRRVTVSALAAMPLYFVAQGAVWSYLFLMGTGAGLPDQQVAASLTLAGAGGVAGGLLPALLGDRLGRTTPLLAGLVAGVATVLYLAQPSGAFGFAVALFIYNFSWSLTQSYLLATYAALDGSGRVITQAAALQAVGVAMGPAIGASLIAPGEYAAINILAALLFSTCVALVVRPAFMTDRARHRMMP
jgi:predicted MFS family arabinose efflux permease